MPLQPCFVAFVLFALTLLYDIVVWGALPALDDHIGASIERSARNEAPLATTYIVIGEPLDAAIPALQAFGADRLRAAFSDGFPRIGEDATVAMDLIFNTTWNAAHRFIKFTYWACPLLLLLSAFFYLRRQKAIHVIKTH